MKSKYSIIALSFFLFLAVIGAGSLFAGPIDPKTVPEKADWYIHVNLDQLAQGKIGDWMAEISDIMVFETGEEGPMKHFTDGDNKISGGVTVYGTGKDPESSVIRATGLTDRDELVTEIKGSKDYETSKDGEHTIHSWVEDADHPHHEEMSVRIYGVFLDDSTMMASQSKETLSGALDFLDNDEKGILAPANAGAAFVARADLEAMSKGADSEVFRSAKSVATSMDVAADGSMTGSLQLEAANAESAEKMTQMINGMVSFGSGYAQDGQWNPGENVKTNRNGNTVVIDLTMPISYMEKMKKMSPFGGE